MRSKAKKGLRPLPSPSDRLKRLRARLHAVMRADRVALLREIGKLQSAKSPEGLEHAIDRLERRLERASAKKDRRRAGLPPVRYPAALPITARRADIVEAIRENPVVVITGETGSGKTTQIPKMCIEAGRGIDGRIGCTQPRRVAAVTVSQRIAEEMGEEPGRSVGYKIRFEERTSPEGFIKIMTDGILLMEAQADPHLNEYDTIIVDEAHERSLNIDFVLGMLKTLLRRRRDLKVVITSATIDTEKFSAAFGGAPIIEVSGRLYPVEIRYEPLEEDPEEVTHVEAAVRVVDDLLDGGGGGDILVFMPTEQDIRDACEMLEGRGRRGVKILPLYARLPSQEQRRVFVPIPERKVVVATNVAETSVTIPGIRYVVDTGLARISYYNPRTRTSGLPVRPISRSSADQRAGRCGRVENGVCIRLYSREDYESRPLYTPPEILRSNLAEVILRMLALRIDDPAAFPFVDPPAPKSIRGGYDILEELGAIERADDGSGAARWRLTERGRRMARLPLDPRIARMILESEREGCLEEILVLAAALGTQDPRERPAGKEKEADAAHARFVNPASDFLTLLTLWGRFHENAPNARSAGRLRRFCRDHFLSFRRMKEWRDVHSQLKEIVEEEGPAPQEKTRGKTGGGDPQAWYGRIHRAVLSGYLSNIAVKKEKNTYTAAGGRQVVLFPGSGLYNRGGDWIVAAELVETTQLFARTAANIDRDWLEPLGGSLCRSTYLNPRWDRRRGEVTATERVSLYGLVIVEERRVSYGRIDPAAATQVFIREALVPGEIDRPPAFLAHNRALIERVRDMENRLRRRTLLATDDVLAAFYEERLRDVSDVRTLQRIIRERGGDAFLRMTEEDVLRQAPDPGELALYPDALQAGRLSLPLSYRFSPGDAADGVTLKLPASALAGLRAEILERAVPGLLRERVTALLKALPREVRRHLVPLPQSAELIVRDVEKSKGPLPAALSESLKRRFRLDVPPSAWDLEGLPDHLKLRYAVVDAKGKEIRSARDIESLQRDRLEEQASRAFHRAKEAWERTGVTRWEAPGLPDAIPAEIPLDEHNVLEGVAYPALVPAGEAVDLRLLRDRGEAEAAHRAGVRTLLALQFRKELGAIRRCLALRGEMKVWSVYFGGAAALEDILHQGLIRRLLEKDIRTRQDFEDYARSLRPVLLQAPGQLLAQVEPVLRAYHETRQALSALEAANRANRSVTGFLGEMRAELDRIVPLSFLERYDPDRLAQLPRYLKALQIRADRGAVHLDRDRVRAAEIRPFEEKLEELQKVTVRGASPERVKAVEEYRWMVEEYRVSVFAQEIRTPYPVSPKRLREKLRQIEQTA
ncbi:MAG: ATP-dependent RNA helicase HrpA [Syntrophaceae bacterium]|nr:ATP-dependent RNA helicase HrpA [Syntrophaceae bacterium]